MRRRSNPMPITIPSLPEKLIGMNSEC